MVTQASLPSAADRYPKQSRRAESRLKISEGLKMKIKSPMMRAKSPAVVGKVSISLSSHSSAHCNDGCQQIFIEVGMEQESSLSGVTSEARIATPAIGASLSVSPQLSAHEPGDQAPFDGFDMEQASSLSYIGSYVLQTVSYVTSL